LSERREDLLDGIVVEDVDFGFFGGEKKEIWLNTDAAGRVYRSERYGVLFYCLS
jgi:hypothetical protein